MIDSRFTLAPRPADIVTAYGKGGVTHDIVTKTVAEIVTRAPRPGLLLAFVGGRHHPAAVSEILANKLPGTTVVGIASAGVISDAGFGCSALDVGLMAWCRAETTPLMASTDRLRQSDYRAGFDLGTKLRAAAPDTSMVLLFYASVRRVAPRQLHSGGSIVDGFYDGWGDHPPLLVGSGALTDLHLTESWVMIDGAFDPHGAVAFAFPPSVKAHIQVLRACRPIGPAMKITKINGDLLGELDGQPALDVIEHHLGAVLIDDEGTPLQIAILGKGWNHQDPDALEDYTNRLILAGDRETNTVTLFEPDFRRGDQIRLMMNDSNLMMSIARDEAVKTRAFANDGGFGRPLAILYLDCAGRASVMSGTIGEEAAVVIEQLSSIGVPLMGHYSGVEIAPVRNRSRSLDWTGVLVTLMHREA